MTWLLAQNVDVNATENDGDASIYHCDTTSAAKILLEEWKVDYKIINNLGKTAVQVKEDELNETGNIVDEADSDDECMKELDELVGHFTSLQQ